MSDRGSTLFNSYCANCNRFKIRCACEPTDTTPQRDQFDLDHAAPDFGQVITMDPMKFAERVFRKAAAAKAHAKSIIDRYEECECPAILGPEVLDILEACDVLRAKLDDHELAEYLTGTEAKTARMFLAIVEQVRGQLLTLTRAGDVPERGVVVVMG